MHFSRRDFFKNNIKYAASMSAMGILPSAVYGKSSRGNYYVSAARISGESGVAGFASFDGNPKLALSGFRGHQVLAVPGQGSTVLMVGRRPDRRVLAFDLDSGHSEVAFETEPTHHLFGHACFDARGDYLFTTEATAHSEQGLIVVRDARDFSVLEQYSSHGVGPHQLCLSHDGEELIVANGGILTRPETGRKALNLASMQPSLDFIRVADGGLAKHLSLPERHASIRHIDVSDRGEVSVAMQLQREAMSHNTVCELCALYVPSRGLALLNAPEGVYAGLNDYVGSTAINSTARIAGFTSPKGNLAVFWNLDTQALAGYHRFHDVCGLAVSADQRYFILSNSGGEIRHLDAVNLREDQSLRQNFKDIAWDNHLTII